MASQLRSFLAVNTRRRSHPWKKTHFTDDPRITGLAWRVGGVFFGVERGFSSSCSQQGRKSGIGVRKRMVPLIKLVHPDLFAQYPPEVASTNSRSLQDLNTLIDAAESLEAAAAGTSNGSVNSSAALPPSVDPSYSLTFFHHSPAEQQSKSSRPADDGDDDDLRKKNGQKNNKNNNKDQYRHQEGDSYSRITQKQGRKTKNRGESPDGSSGGGGGGNQVNSVTNNNSGNKYQTKKRAEKTPEDGQEAEGHRPLTEMRAELRFPPVLSADPARSLRAQLRRQLDGLLRRVSVAPGADDVRGGRGRGGDEAAMMMEGVSVWKGKTEEDFYGAEFNGMFRRDRRKAPPRDGIRTERASKDTDRKEGSPRMTSQDLRDKTIEHAGDNHHQDTWGAGFGSGFLGGGLGGAHGRLWGPDVAAQARSRLVDDLLRSGRVQFAGVPVSREAAALVRLHQVLVKNFEVLELQDRGLWSTVILVLRARSDEYEVQVHSGGPVIVVPEKFSEKNLVLFLGEILLGYDRG